MKKNLFLLCVTDICNKNGWVAMLSKVKNSITITNTSRKIIDKSKDQTKPNQIKHNMDR